MASRMIQSNGKTAVFALTRGYSGIRKLLYVRLLLRNQALRRCLGTVGVDYILFHEGNISLREQKVLAHLSGLDLRFVDVAGIFRIQEHQLWTGDSDFRLGYSLMCRFNYEYVWNYLDEYDVVYRVDEDVVVISLPCADFGSDMLVGGLSEEWHARTNSTLPNKLASMGADRFYDNRFPYTNLYITNMQFWRRPDVKEFVQIIGEDPVSIENRWGDSPILGVALQSLGSWNPEASVDPRISYFHGSHRASVSGGQVIKSDSPLRHKELGWIAWALESLDAVAGWARITRRALVKLRLSK